MECPILSNPTNGVVVVTDRTFTNRATYQCNPGFFLNGVPSRVCQADGLWSDAEPDCIGRHSTTFSPLPLSPRPLSVNPSPPLSFPHPLSLPSLSPFSHPLPLPFLFPLFPFSLCISLAFSISLIFFLPTIIILFSLPLSPLPLSTTLSPSLSHHPSPFSPQCNAWTSLLP